MTTRTLVVEDDPVLAQAHASYVERVPGFVVAGIAHGGLEAVEVVGRDEVDLVLLDFFLPDVGGLGVCRALRARGQTVDVIAVTSERSLVVVQAAISLGVVQYIVKPFTFATFADRLRRYAEYRRMVGGGGGAAAQHDVDRAYATLRTPIRPQLPKGFSTDTLGMVIDALHTCEAPVTATELSSATGTSRVTARRYLEYLTTQRMVSRTLRYGTKGRPEHEYKWSAP